MRVNVPEDFAGTFNVAGLFANSDESDMLTGGLYLALNLKLILVAASLTNELLKCSNVIVGLIPLDMIPANKPRFVATVVAIKVVRVAEYQ